MRIILLPVLFIVLSALSWECPECAAENDGTFCSACHLPEPPPGMVYVPGTTVEIEGEAVQVSGFFIDAEPVSYRGLVTWLNSSGFQAGDLGVVITGGSVDAMEFLAFTPFMGDQNGGLTVPSQMLDSPAASVTWNGAQSYLSQRGKRLPTLAEILAAHEAGLIAPRDVFEAMSGYSSHLVSSMGEMLGTLATQAMFAGYSTARERIMWEFTGTVHSGNPHDTAPPSSAVYMSIFKPAPEPGISAVNRGNGYFNVLFRGAIEVPR